MTHRLKATACFLKRKDTVAKNSKQPETRELILLCRDKVKTSERKKSDRECDRAIARRFTFWSVPSTNTFRCFPDKSKKTAAERSHCVCRRAEKCCITGPARILASFTKRQSWRSRWLLPSSDVISPGGLNTPDLIVCLTTAHTQGTHWSIAAQCSAI